MSTLRGSLYRLSRQFGISKERIQIIHNPCDIEPVQALAAEEPDLPIDWRAPTVVAVGRLKKAKDFPYLPQAFAWRHRRAMCRFPLPKSRAALSAVFVFKGRPA